MARPRTLIAHDHRLFLDGLVLLLGEEFDIAFATVDFTAVLAAVRQYRPTLVVQSLSKQPSVGLRLIGEIRSVDPDIAVAVISRLDDVQLASEALRQGAGAYILTTSTRSEFVEGLRSALTHRIFLSPELSGTMMRTLVATGSPESEALTSRQIAVITSLATGKSMKEVATELDLSTRTVAFHKYSVMQKLRITTTAELVQFAVKRGLV